MSEVWNAWQASADWAAHVTAWRVMPPKAPVTAEAPEALHPRLKAWLAERGLRLYSHQAEAVEKALAGEHVVIVTPAASGKTLCYNLPVMDRFLRAPQSRALYLFPTKALAHDQLHTLRQMAEDLALPYAIAAYDGDTPQSHRARIRQNAQIILTNPDMLHAGILPTHTQWREFLAHLDYVIVDEMHTYRGIFGSHVANVFRRLRRLCAFYGSQPRFICSSATIGNPQDLAERLTGQAVALVERSGAPSGWKAIVFYNPPILDARLGLRRPLVEEVRRQANWFLERDLQTVIFCPTRRLVEQLVTYLRQDAVQAGRDPLAIRGYRGGYLPQERRAIEEGLREGAVRAVVATNALELGVDIGGLAVCLLAGYPGSVASTWQRIGRVGRARETSAALLIASSSPLDQYIVSHPDYFFAQAPERALINPDNPYVLLSHLRCALYELPFEKGEALGQDRGLIETLVESGQAREGRGRLFWAGTGYPSTEVSLRTASPDQVSIVVPEEGGGFQPIGQIDRDSAPYWLHEGAIYLHEGQQYLVERLDWGAGVAYVRPVEVDYFTEASGTTRIDIETTRQVYPRPEMALSLGDVRLTTRVTGYRRLQWETLQHLGWGEVTLPEREMVTEACWVTLTDALLERLAQEGLWEEAVESRGPDWPVQRDRARARDGYRCVRCGAEERPGRQHDVHHIIPFREFGWVPGENDRYREANRLTNLITLCPQCHRLVERQVAVQGALGGLGRVLRHLMPLFLLCDAGDVGIHAEAQAPQTGQTTLFVYDNVPGGVGLSAQLPDLFEPLLERSAELIHGCPCEAGCPSCIGASIRPDPRAKERVLALVAALRAAWAAA